MTEEARARYLKKWKSLFEDKLQEVEVAMTRGFQSCHQVGIAFITIKKDRSGGYIIKNKLWHELDSFEGSVLDEELKYIGASGPLGGYPSDHK